MKFDIDSQSAVTFFTETSSFFNQPSTVPSIASSKLEMQLNFLAKQLHLERQRREKLQSEVEAMAKTLQAIKEEGASEVAKNEQARLKREISVKRPNLDIENIKVLNRGFVAIQ